MTEIAVARTLARQPATLHLSPGRIARQGDIVLRHSEDQPDGGVSSTEPVVVGTGIHGAHVLVPHSTLRQTGPNTWVVATGAVLVHTDEPHARHASIGVPAGTCEITGQVELHGEEVVRVAD